MPARCRLLTVIGRPSRPRAFPSPLPLRPALNAHLRTSVRHYASQSGKAAAHGAGAEQVAAARPFLAGLTDELDRIAPRFEVEADQVEIVRGPREFYEVLKNKISNAKHRVYLSTLYIGKTEHELISTIRDALQRNPSLKVSILTDALRGTREAPRPTTASLLAPLVADFGSARVEIRMYHTANLTGLRKRMLPVRINEGWGLQHMKLYGIDDEIIMSGANLSSDYFTNRQDRYHIFRSAEVTQYFARIHDAVAGMSFDIQPDSVNVAGYRMEWPTTHRGPSPLEDPKGYIGHASSVLGPLIAPMKPSSPSSPPSSAASPFPPTKTTLIYPLFQLTPLLPTPTTITTTPSSNPRFQSTELPALNHLLTTLTQAPFTGSVLTFTAGYFNPTPHLTALLLASRPASAHIIAASPSANGFLGSKGVSGMLPAAYTLLERRFMEQVYAHGLGGVFRLFAE